jgi:hypothetical protein
MNAKIKRNDLIFGASSFACFLLSFVLLKLSGFSSSNIIGVQSYIVRSAIAQTTGMGTLESLGAVIQPFQLVLFAVVFYVLGLSVLAAYGYHDEDNAGKFVGIFAAIAALALFQSMWGAFLAASVLVACVFSASLANMYKKELKKWVVFRVGSHTVGKMFTLLAIFMSAGIFALIMSSQAQYSSVFEKDFVSMTKSIATSVPGAELLDESLLNSQIEGLVRSSPIFESYIRWMPVTSALVVWFVLSFLAFFATILGGAFTYAIIRVFNL